MKGKNMGNKYMKNSSIGHTKQTTAILGYHKAKEVAGECVCPKCNMVDTGRSATRAALYGDTVMNL